MFKVNIDFSGFLAGIEAVGSQSFPVIMWQIFIHGGWVIFLWFFLFAARILWIHRLAGKYEASKEYILLSVSIPKMNEQSPKAVEHFFSQLAGAHASSNWYDVYVKGKTQDVFSLEIVSTEGHIQFIIRTVVHFRDLVEAGIFAQYPDAEIVEVPDYTEGFPAKFPNDTHDLWGTEFILTGKECYPIRTYPEFEHPLTGEFKDPLSNFLENLSHIGKGEHVWYQIVTVPIGQKEWKEKGEKEVKKLIGMEVKAKRGALDKAVDAPLKFLEYAGSTIFSSAEAAPKKPEKPKERSQMQYLSPGEKDIVAGIERKLTKIGFRCKIRAVYVAKKESFSKTRAAHPLIGAIKQFNTVNLNSLKPEYDKIGTGGLVFFAKSRTDKRKTKLMRAYRHRAHDVGAGEGFVLNIEELASLFHFPTMDIKAPFLKKTEAKRAEPPFSLPIEQEAAEETYASDRSEENEEIPDNLPIE